MPVEIAPYLGAGVWPYDAIHTHRDTNPDKWQEVDEDFYNEMMCCMPPRSLENSRFMVGECSCHRERGAMYTALACVAGRYFAKETYATEFHQDTDALKAHIKPSQSPFFRPEF